MLANLPGDIDVLEREVRRRASPTPVLGSRFIGKPESRRRCHRHATNSATRPSIAARIRLGILSRRRRTRASRPITPSRPTRPARIFVLPDVDPEQRFPRPRRGYHTPQMATEGKPYRVYKGGRATGRVPLQRTTPPSGPNAAPKGKSAPGPRRPRNVKRWVILAVLALLLLARVSGASSRTARSRRE